MEDIINKVKNEYDSLCEPSKLYLVIQLLFIVFMLTSLKTSHFFKLFYISVIILWTFIYDALCKNNYTLLSWGLVLGILLSYVLIFLLSLGKKNKLL